MQAATLVPASLAPPDFSHLGCHTDGDARAWAVFSAERTHRYLLCRVWDPTLPVMAWCCCNPSDADAFELDPSARKMIGFAERYNCGGTLVANVLGFATPHTEKLLTTPDPMGPHNVELAVWAVSQPQVSVAMAGWGRAVPAKLWSLAEETVRAVTRVRPMHCVGVTEKAPHVPRHPLMVAYRTPITPWAL